MPLSGDRSWFGVGLGRVRGAAKEAAAAATAPLLIHIPLKFDARAEYHLLIPFVLYTVLKLLACLVTLIQPARSVASLTLFDSSLEYWMAFSE